jgi:hypothetical protein
MAVAVARAVSSGGNSLALPSALTILLRRASVAPGLETRRSQPVRRLQDLSPGDAIPVRSRIVLRGSAACLR